MLPFIQRAGVLASTFSMTSPVSWALWFPMLIFEVTLAIWLLAKTPGSSRE